jgi:hypothetical protein
MEEAVGNDEWVRVRITSKHFRVHAIETLGGGGGGWT